MDTLALSLPGETGIVSFSDPVGGQFPDIASVISKLLPVLFSIAGFILLAMLIWGGYEMLTSGGEPQKVASAKAKMTNALIGFILIFMAYWLSRLAAFIFGLKGP